MESSLILVDMGDAELDALVEQATVDAYDEYEQLTGFHVMIGERLATPFRITVLGAEVTVTKIGLLSGSGVVAICCPGSIGRPSASWICRCPTRPLPVPNGSTLTRRWAT